MTAGPQHPGGRHDLARGLAAVQKEAGGLVPEEGYPGAQGQGVAEGGLAVCGHLGCVTLTSR